MTGQIELLAPAKNGEYGKEAIIHGADAVYIGALNFGARAAVGNSLEDIQRLVDFAHLYDAKVYTTINTILYDHELPQVEELVNKLCALNVDAVIFQDMSLLEMDLPPISLHASTQTNNFDLDRIQFLDKQSIERIILARELSLKEIQAIKATTTKELEYFIHGALCVSLSGQCYLSHSIGGRSANRGKCGQACRLPYDLYDGQNKLIRQNKHLLSIKDLNNSMHIPDLIEAGISSLKIEGRLKDLAYVKNITAFYRESIDRHLENSSNQRASTGKSYFMFEPDPYLSFNRTYTDYFAEGRKEKIGNHDSPKSLGKFVGTVESIKGNNISIKTNEVFENGDGLCFLNRDKELLGFRANSVKGNIITARFPKSLKPGTELFRNLDVAFQKKMEKQSAKRKRAVEVFIENEDSNYRIKAIDEKGIVAELRLESSGEIMENKEMLKSNFEKQFGKTGDSIFELKQLHFENEEYYFVPAKEITQARRNLYEKLQQEILSNYQTLKRKRAGSETQLYTDKLDYSFNVSNKLSEKFYKETGANEIEKAFEQQSDYKGKTVMTTRYCLKFELDACPHKNPKTELKEPMYLQSERNRFLLKFDCKNCMMKVVYDQ